MILRIIIILLSLLNAGFMTFDGTRALITGDYIRPESGKYAGQLGPWSKIAHAIGIDPMSALMKSIFLILGLYGLIAIACFAVNVSIGWKLLLAFCIVSLWYLTFGTISSILAIILLMIWRWKYAG